MKKKQARKTECRASFPSSKKDMRKKNLLRYAVTGVAGMIMSGGGAAAAAKSKKKLTWMFKPWPL